MSDETVPTHDPISKEPFTDIATLVRGRRFTIGTNPASVFEKGIETPVTAKMKARLQRKAFDTVSVGVADSDGPAEQEDRPKFIFRKIGEAKPVAKAPGARVRRVHA